VFAGWRTIALLPPGRGTGRTLWRHAAGDIINGRIKQFLLIVAADKPPPPCADPASHQLDFWVGSWDLVVRARADTTTNQWSEARGTNHIRRTFGGCVIEESFRAIIT